LADTKVSFFIESIEPIFGIRIESILTSETAGIIFFEQEKNPNVKRMKLKEKKTAFTGIKKI
jgi:hypothetical protein